jgi:hypothetical protein
LTLVRLLHSIDLQGTESQKNYLIVD